MFGAYRGTALLDGRAAHQGFDAGLPHLGERAFGTPALAVVQVHEVGRPGHDVADVHRVVGPVGGYAEQAARLQGGGDERGELGLDEPALMVA
ncbi:hypothetical protein D9M72_477950 [compost metagenome]